MFLIAIHRDSLAKKTNGFFKKKRKNSGTITMVLKIYLSAVDYSSDNLAVSQLILPIGSQFVCCFSNFNVHRSYLGTLLNINSDKVCLEGVQYLLF